jgi:AraC-like DNA-binding protein
MMQTVWRFILNGEKGQTFKLESPQYSASTPSSKMKAAVEPLMYKNQKGTAKPSSEIQKYLAMNIIQTNVAGNMDKLLIVRDVSHILYLKKVIETKRSMVSFTESVLKEVD